MVYIFSIQPRGSLIWGTGWAGIGLVLMGIICLVKGRNAFVLGDGEQKNGSAS